MENEETPVETQDETQEGQTVEVEETPTEETDATVETDTSDSEAELAKAKAEAAKYRRLLEKEQKVKQSPKGKAPQSAPSQFNVEETVLLANGMSEELLGELKAVATVRGTSLIKAQTDPIFVAVKEKFERDMKQKEASLPASRGSGSVKPKKDFNSPNLSAEEHKKMFVANL